MKIASLKYQTVFKFVFLKGYCESLQEILEKNWMNEWMKDLKAKNISCNVNVSIDEKWMNIR